MDNTKYGTGRGKLLPKIEEIYKEKVRACTCTRKLILNILAIFLNQKRVKVCEHMVKMASHEFLKGATRGLRERKVEGGGGNEGKIKRKLSEGNTRAVSRGQNDLIGKFKMAVGDVINIRGQVMVYTYVHSNRNQKEVREIWCGL